MERLKNEDLVEIAKKLYKKHKKEFDFEWSETAFIKWCKKKIRTKNDVLVKIHKESPYVYWNYKVESPIDATQSKEETNEKKKSRKKKEE